MPPTRSRAGGLAAAFSLALVGAVAVPALAADSPEAAVNELVDAITSGDYAAIDTLVCEEEREAVRAQLDPGEAMGLEGDDLPISFNIEDRAVELISEDGDTATVALTGTMSIDVAEEDIEAIALEMMGAEFGELSEEDIEAMLPFVQMAFSQTTPLDEEITVVREDGAWLVCGGLGQPAEDLDYGIEPSVSEAGLCGLVLPDELSGLGPVQYDSSNGFADSCTYSTSDYDTYQYTTVSVEFGTDAEYLRQAYGADQLSLIHI